MPRPLQWCVVVTEVEFIGPESSFKRETGTKALVFLPLLFFLSYLIVLYYLFLSWISSVLFTASIVFCFVSYFSWMFHTWEMFYPFAVSHECFVLFYKLFSCECLVRQRCVQLHTSLFLWSSHCSHTWWKILTHCASLDCPSVRTRFWEILIF